MSSSDLIIAAQQLLEACEQRLPLAGQAKVIDELNNLRAALAQEQDEPIAWLRVIDEAMVTHHIGVAEPSDSYEVAKQKMNSLLCAAQDIGAYFAKQAEPVQKEIKNNDS